MAISKERLKELIEKESNIYEYTNNHIWEIQLKNDWYVMNGCLREVKLSKHPFQIWSIDSLFETKAEAEEYAEFGNITRTEKLDLPTWNEFSKWDKSVKFFSKGTKYSMYVFVKNKNTNNCRIMIYADNGEQDWIVFEQPLTKENYDNARRICVKLFRGESV